MPDPLLYLKAMGGAAIASAVSLLAIFVLAMARVQRPAAAKGMNSASVLAMGLGLAVGYTMLAGRPAWPPLGALDRFLMIIVPAVLGVELTAGFHRVPRWVAWLLRISLIVAIPRILWHGSIYLSGSSGDDWTLWHTCAAWGLGSAALASVWGLLCWLHERSPGVSVPCALCLAVPCAGLTVMLAGYIKGGAAAFPLAATLLATTIVVRLITRHSARQRIASSPVDDGLPTTGSTPPVCCTPAILGIGVVSLFGLLFIGRFFGRVSTSEALIILLAPLLCWVTEFPLLRHRQRWVVGSLRLVFVAIPLVAVLILAKREFDREMAPLLGQVSRSRQASPAVPRASPSPHRDITILASSEFGHGGDQ